MKSYIIIEFLIYVNIVEVILAQTNYTGAQTTTFSGNITIESITQTVTQTPKSVDSQTAEYETTRINSNALNNTFDTIINQSTTQSTQPAYNGLTNITTEYISNQTERNENLNSGNLSSIKTNRNDSEEQRNNVLLTDNIVSNITESIDTNSTSRTTESPVNTSESTTYATYEPTIASANQTTKKSTLNETNELTSVYIPNVNQEVFASITGIPSLFTGITVPTVVTNVNTVVATNTSEQTNSSFAETVSTESSVSTTEVKQFNTTNTELNVTHNEFTTQTTESPNFTTYMSSSHTNPDHYYIPTIFKINESSVDSNPNQIQNTSTEVSTKISTDSPQLNISEISSTTQMIIHSNRTENETKPNTNTITPFVEHSVEITQSPEPTKSTQTERPIETERPLSSTQSVPLQTRLTTGTPEHSTEFIPTTTQSIETTQSKSSSESQTTTEKMETISIHSTLPTHITERQETTTQAIQQNQSTEYSEHKNQTQTPEPTVAIIETNNSETTFQLPLTQSIHERPITTSIPFESNISAIRVTLPNIKHIDSMSKPDMINIVTITFNFKAFDIFRWVSQYEHRFRNFTCDCIDSERNWCSIDKVIYVSPSPLIMNNHLIINFFVDDSTDNDLNNYHVFSGAATIEAMKNLTNTLEQMTAMKVVSLQTNLGTMVVKPLESKVKNANFELLVFIFTVVMFICTVLLCLAIICSCAKRKSVDMNQIELSNAGRRQTTTNGGFDLNSASNILRDENHEKRTHNVINLEDGWVAPIDQVIENQKLPKYDNLQDTKL